MSHAFAESAAERVYAEVKEQILTNEIAGGELISEGEIASRCSVSRTPVREAFLHLETEGWMRLYPKRGALVVPIGDREKRDVVDARRLLESHAVRSVTARPAAVAELVERLRDNLDAHRRADATDVAEFSRLDAEFHQLIAAAGDNPLLADFYTTLGERHRRMTIASVHRDAGVATRILADHLELLGAVESTDADRFEHLLAGHLAGVHDLPGELA
ncbi:GntR family transcriptional regulator [Gordonia rubripertincta]|uniref:GntR family transcriptional regulator n=2 Tax=Gordonia rubripertincta TaxID=36822 RepID=A0AAW6RBB2_GORRU|nr:GntR family transcriptional regulator [Gordonia rubripertincta]MDG6780966.1 GntR family transcriptional regulator [Gordonia rubripertincta]GAB85638.1 putative GntR family transcriptional regulator [Gordonia rubripertincta NBRC 101908]